MKISFENIEKLFPNAKVQRDVKIIESKFEIIYLPDFNIYIHLVKINKMLTELPNDYFQKMSIILLLKGYNIIHLFEDQLLHNQKSIKDRFASLLNSNQRIFARSCKIERIQKDIYDDFIEQNHLMDTANTRFKYGIYYKGELMGVMGISAGRWMTKEGEKRKSFEIIRFATKSNFTIVGGFTKFLKHIKNELEVDEFMTYLDLDWAISGVYQKNNFIFKSFSNPLKFFIHKKTLKRFTEKQILSISDFNDSNYISTYNSGNMKLICKYE
ncbi:MAG: hypothetical protein ACK45U_09995 [bacterium]|jgi:hypothetical protein